MRRYSRPCAPLPPCRALATASAVFRNPTTRPAVRTQPVLPATTAPPRRTACRTAGRRRGAWGSVAAPGACRAGSSGRDGRAGCSRTRASAAARPGDRRGLHAGQVSPLPPFPTNRDRSQNLTFSHQSALAGAGRDLSPTGCRQDSLPASGGIFTADDGLCARDRECHPGQMWAPAVSFQQPATRSSIQTRDAALQPWSCSTWDS